MNEGICIFNIFLNFKEYRFYFIFQSTELPFTDSGHKSFYFPSKQCQIKRVSCLLKTISELQQSVTASQSMLQVSHPVLQTCSSLEMVLLPAGILAGAEQYLAQG